MLGKDSKILVTGAAGFIGFFLCKRLLQAGVNVLGVDNLNSYYDVKLKENRLGQLQEFKNFEFSKTDIANEKVLNSLFEKFRPHKVMHLAAQAGVRYSLENPHAYIDSNISGFLNILENCRHQKVEHLAYASTSSVYGLNTDLPFREDVVADHPVSLYGATKRANELMAHSYSHLFKIPTTGLRFFTVYGPWGRPDMALFLFTKKILAGEPIDVFNNGNHQRDFTYVEDIVSGLYHVLEGKAPSSNENWNSKNPNPATSSAPFRIYNIGNNRSEKLIRYIEVLEECLGKKAIKNMLPLQAGDVQATHANVDAMAKDFGYQPTTSIEEGVRQFVQWYREYFGV